MFRDLTIGKHPLLIGRSWPHKVHHWTHGEFENFLDKNCFPANTWSDQQEGRKRVAIDALVKGVWVPAEVLTEDPQIVADAEAVLNSQRASDAWHDHLKTVVPSMIEDFELKTGYAHSMEIYLDWLKSTVRAMLLRCSRVGKSAMQVDWNGWNLTLNIVGVKPPTFGAFGPYGGKAKHVSISGEKNGYRMHLHEVSWLYVESAIRDLLIEGAITYDQLWFWTEVGYQPPRSSVVTKTDAVVA
jgi:hypothetical protein